MKANRRDRSIVLWLIAALLVETLLLLWHLDIVSFGTHGESKGARPAGHISHSENELRRRGVNSLVWEKTQVLEPVYFHDSLLTLSQSTARLALEHGTEVELSENTLVTIEPQSATTSGEIRLRFTRGNLQARNPFRPTEIQAPEFSLAVEKGSDLELRQVGDGEFEVRVAKGEAVLEDSKGKHKIDVKNLMRVRHGEARSFHLDQGLQWVNPPSRRIYVHDSRASVELKWRGPVRDLVIQRTGTLEREVAVQGERAALELETGHYQIYPRGAGGETGAPLEIEIWRAPTLHLITPLPRNRIKTDEQAFFLWTRIPEASSYVLVLRDADGVSEFQGIGNSYSTIFSDEMDANWSVWAVDKGGFRIPPAYEYPIYIRHAPLDAPKLKAPRLRRPASSDRGARLWNLILPRAHADEERFEVVLEWEAVSGAIVYWLEISETPDFRHPVVSERLDKTQFVWSEAKKKTYFWRVASGGRGGRMGRFSEPAKIEQDHIQAPVTSTTTIKQAPDPVPAPGAAAASDFDAKAGAGAGTEIDTGTGSRTATETVPLHSPYFARLLWRGGYQAVGATAEEDVSANLSGMNALNFAAEVDGWIRNSRWWRISAEYSSALFQPSSKAEYPFQKGLRLTKGKFAVSRMDSSSIWSFGLTVALLPEIYRSGLESISARDRFTVGPHLQALKQIWHVEYRAELSALIGTKGYGMGTAHRALIKPWSEFGLLTGMELNAIYLMDRGYHNFSADALLVIGYQY